MTRPLARMAAILLLAWQAIAMQAHLHAPQGPAVGPLAAHASAGLTAPERRREAPADCPICREIAHAGHYLTPGPVLFTPPATTLAAEAPATPVAFGHAERSHFWRSRAPPSPQA